MTRKTNDWKNGLANATALTTANTGYDSLNDAFDVVAGDVKQASAATLGFKYTDVNAAATTGTANVVSYWQWDSAGNDVVFDARLLLPVAPTSRFVIVRYLAASRREHVALSIAVLEDGRLQVLDEKNAVIGTTVAAAIVGEWFRIRVRALLHTTTRASNVVTLDFYGDANAKTSLPTETLTINGANLGANSKNFEGVRVGVLSPSKTAQQLGVGIATVNDTGYPAAPTITSFTPSSAATGATVTLTGTNFLGAASVRFRGVPSDFKVVSNTSITAIVPSGTTDGKITANTPGGAAESATDFGATSGTGGTIAFADVTPLPGYDEGNATVYTIPSATYEASILYELLLAPFNAGGLAEIAPTITGGGLTWTSIGSYASGTNALVKYRCVPGTNTTTPITITFVDKHEGLQWMVTRISNYKNTAANGADAVGIVASAASGSGTTATVTLTGYTTGAGSAWLAAAQINGVGDVIPQNAAVELRETYADLQAPLGSHRTLCIARKISDDAVPTFLLPGAGASWRLLACEYKPGTGGVPTTATRLKLYGDTSNLQSGATRVIQAKVLDSSGAVVVSGSESTLAITLAKDSGGGTVTGLGVVNAIAGVATFTITGGSTGTVVLKATSGALTTAAADKLTLTVAAGVTRFFVGGIWAGQFKGLGLPDGSVRANFQTQRTSYNMAPADGKQLYYRERGGKGDMDTPLVNDPTYLANTRYSVEINPRYGGQAQSNYVTGETAAADTTNINRLCTLARDLPTDSYIELFSECNLLKHSVPGLTLTQRRDGVIAFVTTVAQALRDRLDDTPGARTDIRIGVSGTKGMWTNDNPDAWFPQSVINLVDFFGVDAYSKWYTTTYQSFDAMYLQALNWATSKGKPLMINESGVEEHGPDGGAGKAAEYRDAKAWILEHASTNGGQTGLVHVMWNTSTDGDAPIEYDWPPFLTTTGDAAFKDMLQGTHFP